MQRFRDRAVYILVLKVIRQLLWFAFMALNRKPLFSESNFSMNTPYFLNPISKTFFTKIEYGIPQMHFVPRIPNLRDKSNKRKTKFVLTSSF